MKILKRILLVLAGVVLIVQFIRPAKNAGGDTAHDIGSGFSVPSDLAATLRVACYDCHSNETRYPWYAEVQPVGWWLNGHIQDAKRQLNFSEFTARRLRWQYHKFEEITEQVGGSLMPLPSYLILHTDAKLSQMQRDNLVAWANAMRDSMKAKYPLDSLERRR
jgi:hypothetical protein